MYKCSLCDVYYDLSEENENEISKVNSENPVIQTIVICPRCENKRIVGGELDWDEIDEKDIIMMFGREFDEKEHHDLPQFKGVTVKAPEYDIIQFIKNQDLLSLKDRVQIVEIVSNYFKECADGNDINRILQETFGR